ncbi:MAG: leucine-rich repeat domain-containing protein [Tidjanibacter sp.]|nr:leucine-rich repeat domain-containing protein [Tidjanibacter sp.]
MKKLYFILLTSLVMMVGCAEINERLDNLEGRVDDIENTQITTLEQQISAISATIPNLEKADLDLKDYILALQKEAGDLEASIAATNTKIDEMKEALEGDIDAEVASVITLLEGAKSEIEAELATINTLIEQLQAKDVDLENKIAELKEYVNGELKSTEDWVEATFATLEQYNSLALEVATVKVDIETINASLDELEESIGAKIKDELSKSIETIKNELLESMANDIAEDYTEAIATARQEITTAYKKAIQEAIESVESDMQSWVNTQLAGYYTIAETDAKLKALQTALESKIAASEAYLEEAIADLESAINKKIDANSKLITSLTSELSSVSDDVTTNANSIITNTKAIEKNANNIKKNGEAILANSENIEANATLIAENKKLISQNNNLIKQNQSAITALQERVGTNEDNIATNATNIANNAADIAANAQAIANNASAIADNLAAITTNAADIAALQEELVETTKEITTAYKSAISEAITTLNGELRDALAEEVATINATIEALTARVTTLEKEVKNIKVSIYNIQNDIAVLQEQVAAIMARIQSISYVPQYADGKATMYYTNSNGVITAGSATLDFELQPASTAEELVEVWENALSVKAVYTQTRALGAFVNLTIESVTATDGILSVVVSGDALDESFFRSEISANVRLQISDGNNQLASEYVNMVPFTTDNIYIPDEHFKAALLKLCDTNEDFEITAEEAEAVTSLDVSAIIPQITSLSGIEYFTNLEVLDCSYNKITSLNLLQNTKLKEVYVSTNQLTTLLVPATVTKLDASGNKLSTLDVSKMKSLTSLNVTNNKLGSLNVSQNKELTELLCLNNELVSLDVTNLLALTELNCSNNNIERLNLTKNTALTTLDVSKNALVELDVTKTQLLEDFLCSDNALTRLYLGNLTKLPNLDCSGNALSSLDVSGCSALVELNCSNNTLASLDIIPVQKLQTLDCSSNALAMLNISNNPALTSVDCSDNENLVKLWTKNEEQAASVAITKDASTNIFYNNGGILIPDAALKAYLVNNYDDDGDGEISIIEADNIVAANFAGKGVSDITGLECCTNLTTINCSNNTIAEINLPTLTNLSTLVCYGNPITKLNLDNCKNLSVLNLQSSSTNAVSGTGISISGYSQAKSFDFSAKNTPLTSFTFKNTSDVTALNFVGDFTDITVDANTALTSLTFSAPVVNATIINNSSLEGVDVSTLDALKTLDIQKCKLQSLDVTKNLALTSLVCSENELTSLDVSNSTSLVKLYCNKNKLPKINVTANTALQEFDIADNLLSALNVRNNTALTCLNVNNNTELSMVDVQYNTALTELYCNSLAIGELNIVNNTALTNLECHTNPNFTTLTCANDFDFNKTHISIDKGLDIFDINGNVLTPSIGDWITVNLQTGIVFTTSNTSIKMVSLTSTDKTWSEAKKWCSNYGTGWYLPTIDELEVIYKNKSTINSTLSANDYTTLSNRYHWSSEEYNSTYAYVLNFSNGDCLGYGYGGKSQYLQVRAVIAF